MPKHDILINPGMELSKKTKNFLKDYFSENEFERLKKFGGRIQISLTSPYQDRKKQNSNFVIDKIFVKKLRAKPSESKERLKKLTKSQLSKVAEILKLNISSDSTSAEIQKIIFDFLNSSEKWLRISK